MKKLHLLLLCIAVFASCKRTEFSPEGPTDVRIENNTNRVLTNVIYKTSEKDNDVDTITSIASNQKTDYVRFIKAYPKLQISAVMNVNGNLLTYSTGPIDFTYMQYIGQDKITFSVYISSEVTKKLEVSCRVEEALVLK